MYKIVFYKDSNGCMPTGEYVDNLLSKTDKDSRIKSKKILDYIDALTEYGVKIGMPMVKHIDGNIWELRPLKDRIFFFCFHGDTMVLLHHFTKKTQKTPKKEILQAKRNMIDFIDSQKRER